MKIRVVPRWWIENQFDKSPSWILGKWIISIYSRDSFSPIPVDRYNILKLNFDDVTEQDPYDETTIHFNNELAKMVIQFVKMIEDLKGDDGKRTLYVHCDAGVSRSGAVGYMLNEWFNKFVANNRVDNDFFVTNNNHIMPNPEVVRILKSEMFGTDYAGVFVNDYTYNEDGERIDHIKQV